VLEKNELKIHQFNNVISYLEHENAVADPTGEKAYSKLCQKNTDVKTLGSLRLVH
jgi:hypothetical protein